MPTLLILEDDPDVAQAARLALRKLAAVAVRTAPEALPAALDEVAPDVLLLDMNFAPGASDGAVGWPCCTRCSPGAMPRRSS